jgi:UDP-N-acetyl-D-mannosaminuronic acid dehydrogenase
VKFTSLCVLGLGYIGLPTACTFATHGLKVLGVDVNRRVVDLLKNGEIHLHEPGLRTLAQAAFRSGNLEVRAQASPADAFLVAVPTPVAAGDPPQADLSFVTAAAEMIVPHLRRGNLVVLESTSPPRTTVEVVGPILQRSGLRAGPDFLLAYSPERVLPGQILRELVENARVVGGIDRASAEAARDLYALFVRGEIVLSDATTAEMVKLMENTYRDVNVALANEFARLAERLGVDVWKARQLANLHPRVDILRPGPGVGGHCIPLDPWFLAQAAPGEASLIPEARRVNDAQPEHTVALIERAVGGLQGRRLAALGLAYKADVDDLRESPAVAVVRGLLEGGAEVKTWEPHEPEAVVEGARAATSLDDALRGAEAVVLLVDHSVLRDLDPAMAAAALSGRTAVDTRGVWSPEIWEAAGFRLTTLGVGRPR